MLFYWN